MLSIVSDISILRHKDFGSSHRAKLKNEKDVWLQRYTAAKKMQQGTKSCSISECIYNISHSKMKYVTDTTWSQFSILILNSSVVC